MEYVTCFRATGLLAGEVRLVRVEYDQTPPAPVCGGSRFP